MAGDWDTPDLSALLVAFSRNLDRIQQVVRGRPLVRWAMTLVHALNANTRVGRAAQHRGPLRPRQRLLSACGSTPR